MVLLSLSCRWLEVTRSVDNLDNRIPADLLARSDPCLVYLVGTHGCLALVLVGRCARPSSILYILSLVGIVLSWLAYREISRVLFERRTTGLVELGEGAFQNARQATVPSEHVREGI